MNRFCFILLSAVLFMGEVWPVTALAGDESSASNRFEDIAVLDIATAARIALRENPTLAVAQARVEQAREAVNQARSTYWPRLDLNASGSRVELSDSEYQYQSALYRMAFGSNATVDDPKDYYTAELTASWVLFNGFARKFSLVAASYGEQSSVAARDDAQRLLLQAVANAFLSAQLAVENIAIAKADEAFNQRLLTEAKLRYEVGTGALSDVLNFEVKANSAQSERITAEKSYQTARIGLAALLGLPQARLPEGMKLASLEPVTPARLEAPQLSHLLEEAYAKRPDLGQSDTQVRQAEANVEVKKADYFPTVSLFASYSGERQDDLGFEGEDFGNTVGIQLSYNIFAGGLYKAQHQEAKASLHQAEKSRDNTKITITKEVQSGYETVLSAQKQLLLQRKNAELVQKNRDLVEKEYKAGVGSLVRLNEAQRDLTAAQVRLAAAQTTLHQAWYDLWTGTGQILQEFKL